MRRFRYLLGLTDLFRHFIEANSDPRIRNILAEIDRQDEEEAEKGKKGTSTAGARRGGRRTEKEEDAELVKETGQSQTVFRDSPAFVKGKFPMRPYQVAGLNWLVSLHENGISGILADEMGLGKTLQTISFLGYLRYFCGISGPHLIAVPKSTLDNWRREFEMWIPEINVLILQGAKEERHQLMNERLVTEDFDVCITSYEMILREAAPLRKFAWEYIIIDEAHRIKNENSSLSGQLRTFKSRNRLLITGTPLQNNLHELWSLLNFLLPDVFTDSAVFDSWVSRQEEGEDSVIQQLHRVLRPFLLRRIKSDVEKGLKPKQEVVLPIPMSAMQIKWYKRILEKDIDAVNNTNGKRESRNRLLNIVMQLKKCCNHPYLFDGAEEGPPYTQEMHIVHNAGKMVFLHKLLMRLKKQGSRVLIFSQMSRMLDILEDYCIFLGEHKYCRIDGGTAHEDRIAAIDEFNKEGSEKFLFLLTTRAGGLGINLTSADIVILFDSDWNPQADLQAMDRAHRIGQTKQVVVYRFVTEVSVEEKVLERAAQKLRLDQLVIQEGRGQQAAKAQASKDEIVSMIQYGASQIMQKQGASGFMETNELGEDEFEALLKRGEQRTAEINAKYEKLGIDDLQNFSSESAYEWNGQEFKAKPKTEIATQWIEPGKRERKDQLHGYSVDKYYRQALAMGGRPAEEKKKQPPKLKQVTIHDYQFYPEELSFLQDKEAAWHRKEHGIKAELPEADDRITEEERERDRELEQSEIDAAVPLTEEEHVRKEELLLQGFGNWSRRDVSQFVNAAGTHGRTAWAKIAGEIADKTEKQVREYGKVFWEKWETLSDYKRYHDVITNLEAKRERERELKAAVNWKMSQYKVPQAQMKIVYSVSTTNKKVYNEEEDRFLVCMLHKHGVSGDGLYEAIRREIFESPLFRFDWFFLSRTPIEISRRCSTLLTAVLREYQGTGKSNGIVKGGRAQEIEDDESSEIEPPAKKAKNGIAKVCYFQHNIFCRMPTDRQQNKQLSAVKGSSKASTAQTSRAASVNSRGSTPKLKANGKATGKALPIVNGKSKMKKK